MRWEVIGKYLIDHTKGITYDLESIGHRFGLASNLNREFGDENDD